MNETKAVIRKNMIAAGIQTVSTEKVAVRTRADADQHKTIMLDVVNQQPVRMNVAFPESDKVSDQIVIAIIRRQRLPVLQHLNDVGQIFQIQTTPLHQLAVFFELRGFLESVDHSSMSRIRSAAVA